MTSLAEAPPRASYSRAGARTRISRCLRVDGAAVWRQHEGRGLSTLTGRAMLSASGRRGEAEGRSDVIDAGCTGEVSASRAYCPSCYELGDAMAQILAFTLTLRIRSASIFRKLVISLSGITYHTPQIPFNDSSSSSLYEFTCNRTRLELHELKRVNFTFLTLAGHFVNVWFTFGPINSLVAWIFPKEQGRDSRPYLIHGLIIFCWQKENSIPFVQSDQRSVSVLIDHLLVFLHRVQEAPISWKVVKWLRCSEKCETSMRYREWRHCTKNRVELLVPGNLQRHTTNPLPRLHRRHRLQVLRNWVMADNVTVTSVGGAVPVFQTELRNCARVLKARCLAPVPGLQLVAATISSNFTIDPINRTILFDAHNLYASYCRKIYQKSSGIAENHVPAD